MNSKYFLENEQLISQSDGGLVTLTNLRIRYSNVKWGNAYLVSILLEKVSSVEVHYRSKMIFAILAVITIIAAIVPTFRGEEGMMGILLGAGILLFIFYLASRKHVLTISSVGGAKIDFKTHGMKREKIQEFINHLDGAIKKRQEELNKG